MDEDNKEIVTPETTETVETEVEVETEIELDDPFKNVPKFNSEEDYKDLEVDPVEMYRKGLKEGLEISKGKTTEKAPKAEERSEERTSSDDLVAQLLGKVDNLEKKLSQSDEQRQAALYSQQLAQNNTHARATLRSYERGLESTLAKAGLEFTSEIDQGLNNMLATVEARYGRPLSPAETREVTEFHYERLKPWIKANANKEITVPERPATNVGGAGKALPIKPEVKTKASEVNRIREDTVAKMKKGEMSRDNVWDLLAKVAPQ